MNSKGRMIKPDWVHLVPFPMSDNNFMSLNPPENIAFGDETNYLLDCVDFDGPWLEDDDSAPVVTQPAQVSVYPEYGIHEAGGSATHHEGTNRNMREGMDIQRHHESTEVRKKVAFKIRSETDTLDDGFKWRKYGKKMVKNSPNPRNYYRCSVDGCAVKKRVERDRDDPMYVIATYEGIHNHETPRF